ncbi:MAG: T9SS type A sorting domain-containing protein [Flavobacteriales bacterium]
MRTPYTFALCILVSGAFAQAGTLDPSFDGDGIAICGFAGLPSNGQAVAVQADQKIVEVGWADYAPEQKFAVARYNTDGTLDNTFSGDGWLFTPVNSADAEAFAVAIQADQKILVGGTAFTDLFYYGFGLVRYNTDGTLDASFGTNGKVTTLVGGGPSQSRAIAVQADGKILMTGWSYAGGPDSVGVVRYNANGTVDAGFGVGGVVSVGGTGNMDAYAIAVQPDGKIVVAGDSGFVSAARTFVLRLNADGTPDASFGNGGLTTASMGTGASEGFSLALQSDGKIITCGRSNSTGNYDLILFRFNADGTLDNTFDGDGKVSTALTAGNDAGRAVAVQPDGKILAAGSRDELGTFGIALVRYLANGTPDNTFGTNGVAPSPTGLGYGICLQADGRVVVGGRGETDVFSTWRYFTDAGGTGVDEVLQPIDASTIYPNPATDQVVLSYVLHATAAVTCTVFGADGRMVDGYSSKAMRSAGQQRETIDVSRLASGSYLVVLSAGGSRRSVPFAKQ